MNDLINKLLHKAMSQSFNRIDRDGDMDKMYIPSVFAEEFVEVVVLECISIAKQQRDPHTLNYKPSERFAEDLTHHFGIEQ